MSDRPLTVLLTCFPGARTAGSARRALAQRLTRQGDVTLQTTVLSVDARHHARLHDPQRVLRGTLTAALTWGAFGLVAGTNRVESTIIWAVLGAICGGAFAYTSEHLLRKDELTRLGRRLPAPSSALISYVRSADVPGLLKATQPAAPSAASAVSIGADLQARVFAGASTPIELPHPSGHGHTPPDQDSVLSMILIRYPDTGTGRQVAAQASAQSKHDPTRPQVELVVETDAHGRRHVADPAQGVAAMSRSDVVSWGGFGVVVGAVAGLTGGGGILGFLEDGFVTGVAWAVFGLAAGALYGLWAGRSISAHRLSGIGDILPRGSSAVLAWQEGPVTGAPSASLEAPGAQRFVLRFNPIEGGAVLEAL
jgi:hypothetical protein